MIWDWSEKWLMETCALTLLLFEKILKGLAGIVGTGRAGRGLALHGHARLIKRAFVSRVFSPDPLFDGAAALQRSRGLKVSALLAAMELEAATRALPGVVRICGEDGAASGAANDRMRPRQVRGSRAKELGLGRRRLPGSLFASVGILVASLSIFSVSHRFSFFPPRNGRGDLCHEII
jgi:hypothetical protein